MTEGRRLRMVLATPLDETLCRLVESREPRVELVRDHDLLPPMRQPGGHSSSSTAARSTSTAPAWRRW